MNKLEMAHDWFMKHGRESCYTTTDIASAWKYADAMQAEADKREDKTRPAVLSGSVHPTVMSMNEFHDACVKPNLEEWQPDWSQAPDCRVDHWSKESNETATWWIGEPTRNIKEGTHHDNDHCECVEDAPLFDYSGDWQDSLRKRPE